MLFYEFQGSVCADGILLGRTETTLGTECMFEQSFRMPPVYLRKSLLPLPARL